MPTRDRIIIAITIVIVSALLLIPFFFSYMEIKNSIDSRYNELSKPQEPYTFELPLYFDFNGTSRFGSINTADFGFLLNVTYPNGTLVINEPIEINFTAVITKVVETLDSVTVIFPSSLVYPVHYGENNLPSQGILFFENPFSTEGTEGTIYHNIFYQSTAVICFPMEGDYKPLIKFTFKDGSSKIAEVTNVNLHVYPKEQLTALDTARLSLQASQASLRMSEAVFVLGTISVIALVVQVLDHSETDRKQTKETTNSQDKQSNINQGQPQRFDQVKKHKKSTD